MLAANKLDMKPVVIVYLFIYLKVQELCSKINDKNNKGLNNRCTSVTPGFELILRS